MDITGVIDKHTMRLADGVTITGDVTISDDLVLSKISDDGNAITMTNDGSSRTITGSGSIEASTLSQTPNQSLTGMTGTLSSGVTGSPNLNLTNFTGTIGSGVSLNHDAQKYSWSRYIDTDNDYTSDSTIDFQQAHYMGSGITESGGVITIGAGGGGLYLVSACQHNHSNTASISQWSFKVSGTEIANPSMYTLWNATQTNDYYQTAGTLTLPIPLDAGDTIEIYGTAYVTSNPDTSFFNGVRIGAKT